MKAKPRHASQELQGPQSGIALTVAFLSDFGYPVKNKSTLGAFGASFKEINYMTIIYGLSDCGGTQ